MPLVAFCLSHFLADFITCMCVFDFRQAQALVAAEIVRDDNVAGLERRQEELLT